MTTDSEHDAILGGLPEMFPTAQSAGNYLLTRPVAMQQDELMTAVNDLDSSMNIQSADSIAKLQRLAQLVDLPPEQNESVEHYRARLAAEFQLITGEGTIEDVLSILSLIFEINSDDILYSESSTANGIATASIPTRAVSNTPLANAEVARISERVLASSYSLELKRRGTFTYVTPTEYNNSNMDATKGYDGLDSNGDPKNNGGTYAGTLS